MPINYSNLRSNLTARKLIAALKRDGFFLRRQTGSHQQWQHNDGRKVTVSYHRGGDTFPTTTLKKMIERQAQWTEDDLRRLRLLR